MVAMGVTKIGNTQAPKLLYNETHMLTVLASLISTPLTCVVFPVGS